MAYKPQAGAQMAAPNVIPMADIMLVLLIIFMVVTPMLQKSVSVDMATVNNPRDMQDADKDDAIIVAVTRDGNIYLGNTKITKEEITGQIKDKTRQHARQDRLRQERCPRQVRRRRRRRRRNPLCWCRSARSADREVKSTNPSNNNASVPA